MRRLLLLLPFLFLGMSIGVYGQDDPEHAKWSFKAEKTNVANQFKIIATATIDKGWHIFDVEPMEGILPPTHTRVYLSEPEEGKQPQYVLVGTTKSEGKPHVEYDQAVEMETAFFEDKAVITQIIELKADVKEVVFFIDFQCCDASSCTYPWPVEYKVAVPAGTYNAELISPSADVSTVKTDGGTAAIETEEGTTAESQEGSKVDGAGDETNDATQVDESNSEYGSCNPWDDSEVTKGMWPNTEDEDRGLLSLFLLCFGAGLLALLTPCVFPMIPMTVNFFIKQSKSKRAAITNAITYGVSIIAIYTGLGLILTASFGAEVMNDMASHGIVNFVFFAVFLIFGFSFLGAFEITLPSWIINKTDAQADKGGLVGIFFMAFTLAVVSFSCTGPIIGNLLVAAAGSGSYLGPAVGMFGFSLALAIPFMLFAIFPSWLANMPKSGGWLNSVKVVLGLAELALAMKFLSNVDLAYHWGILTREIFVSTWVVVAAFIGLYLLGKLKFSHDSDLPYISVPRVFLALLFLSFSVYMVPGLFGAPLKLLSGIAPPGTHVENYNWMRRGQSPGGDIDKAELDPDAHCPNDLPCTQDYCTALEYARKHKKPVFIDFTGFTCVNCRKMEETVWIDPRIDEILRNEFVVASLYVDDKNPLPAAEQQTVKINGRDIKMRLVGDKWKFFQQHRTAKASQPYYVLVGPDEQMLNNPAAYTPNVAEYEKWLKEGLAKFKERYP